MTHDAPIGPGDIAHYFRLILGRLPESEAVVSHYAGMGLSAAAFVRVLLDSEEVGERTRRRLALAALDDATLSSAWPDRPGVPRVLLFGAYGNGNLGDSAQAEAMAGLLPLLRPEPLSLGASSWERRAGFAFAAGVRLPPDAVLRGDLLPDGRAGGLLAIGGGGVLGTPHFPLFAPRWTEWLASGGTPWALIGVGGSAGALAEPAWARAYRTLIEGAAFVGVRDAATLEAARAINPDAAWFPDPVLAQALLQAGPLPGDPAEWEARPVDVLAIPRHPNSPEDAAANRALLGWCADLAADGRRVVIAAMERALDAPMLAGRAPVFTDDWAVLMGLCREARLVASLRLHGAVAGVAAGCVVHGLVQPKLADLLGRLGIGAWFAPAWPPSPPDLSAGAWRAFGDALAPGLAQFRRSLAAALQQASQALARTAREMF